MSTRREFGRRDIYRSLLMILAGATQKELARHVRHLKVENQILRSKLPARIDVTDQERNRLIRLAENLGAKALIELATIAPVDANCRWIREQRIWRKANEAAQWPFFPYHASAREFADDFSGISGSALLERQKRNGATISGAQKHCLFRLLSAGRLLAMGSWRG